MKPDLIGGYHKHFENFVHVQNGVEFWFVRDLQNILGYSEWRNFLKVFKKAQSAGIYSNHPVSDHFVNINKMVSLGSGYKRKIDDLMLARPACYLITLNGYAGKDEIAFTAGAGK